MEEVNRNVTIRVDRADLAGALSMVRRSVPRASHLHGFRHEGVRLRYAGETLEVSATGPELSVDTQIDVQPLSSQRAADVLVGVGLITGLVHQLEPGDVAIKLAPDGVDIRSGAFSGSIRILDPDRHAVPRPPVESRFAISVDGTEFADALAHVSLALGSVSVWRGGIQGITLEVRAGHSLRFVATDREHLAVAYCRDVQASGRLVGGGAVRLPIATVILLTELDHRGERVLIEVGDAQVDITVGRATVRSCFAADVRLDDRPMTGTSATHRLSVTRRTLATVIRRVGLMANDPDPRLWFELHEQRSLARTANHELGEASERFPAEFEGVSCEIGIGLPVLLAMVERLTDGRVVFEFNDADKVVSIHSEKRPDFRYFTTLVAVPHRPWTTRACGQAPRSSRVAPETETP